MITIIKLETGKYSLECTNGEDRAIDWLMQRPRKFERFLEEYLASRLINMEYQKDQQVLSSITPEEKETIIQRIEQANQPPVIIEEPEIINASQLEPTDPNQ